MAKSANGRIRLLIALTLLACCVGCDQATKQIAVDTLRGRPPEMYLANALRLEYALNPGGFLSLGANLAPGTRFWVFVVLNIVFLSATGCLLVTRWDMRLVKFVAIVLIFAGGLGNVIDRVLQNGCVTDFINVGIGPLRTGIFNVADVALTAGALILSITYCATCDAQPDHTP